MWRGKRYGALHARRSRRDQDHTYIASQIGRALAIADSQSATYHWAVEATPASSRLVARQQHVDIGSTVIAPRLTPRYRSCSHVGIVRLVRVYGGIQCAWCSLGTRSLCAIIRSLRGAHVGMAARGRTPPQGTQGYSNCAYLAWSSPVNKWLNPPLPHEIEIIWAHEIEIIWACGRGVWSHHNTLHTFSPRIPAVLRRSHSTIKP